MPLKSSFAHVLRAIRNKRSITQRHFADTVSRTYLSKLETGKSSITLDKLEQVSRRLELSPLTLLALALSEDTEETVADLIQNLRTEMLDLQREGGLPGLHIGLTDAHDLTNLAGAKLKQRDISKSAPPPMALQEELAFID